jgi:hypothetical protein
VEARQRQRLIFEKTVANAQRHQREQLLREFPPLIREKLAGAACSFFPVTEELLRRFLPITASGIGDPDHYLPAGYSFREVGWASKALALLPRSIPATEDEAYLVLRSPNWIDFQDKHFLVPELPVFRVEFRWGMEMFEQFWPLARKFLALVRVDFSKGVVIDNYLGILAEDPNPAEVVFEIAVW